MATLEWVLWFNNHRPLELLAYSPPAEAEANYWRQQPARPCRPDSHQPAATKAEAVHERDQPPIARFRAVVATVLLARFVRQGLTTLLLPLDSATYLDFKLPDMKQ